MPIFEYRCGACRKRFEKIVLSAASVETIACPHCGAVSAEKLVSRFATTASSKGGGEGGFGELGDDLGDDEGAGYGGPESDEGWDGSAPGEDDDDYAGGSDDESGEEDD